MLRIPVTAADVKRLPGALLIAVLTWPTLADTPENRPVEALIAQVWKQCKASPEYRVGGGAWGDCLLAATGDLESVINLRLYHLREFECPEVADAISDAQMKWLDYREAQCGLFRKTFDNTPSYISAAECHLRLTIMRDHDLDMFDRTRPRSRNACE